LLLPVAHPFVFPPPVVSYTHILEEIRTGHLKQVIVGDDLRETTLVGLSGKTETLAMDPALTTQVIRQAMDYHVDVGYKKGLHPPDWLMPSVLYIPFFALGWNLVRRFQSFTPAFQPETTVGNHTFQDWGGSKEVLRECKETIRYFLDPPALVKQPKGVLLEGPPGTGKTLLGKILAHHTNATFLAFSASNFVELYVGMGALRVRKLFEHARNHKPCILFIDEIDAIGQHRKQTVVGNNEEREQTLNQLLYEMDGFHPQEGILVVAATNRKEILDEALLRPGRFDKVIHVPLPDRASRRDILRILTREKDVEEGVDWDMFVEQTDGFSGADLEQWVNEAGIYSLRANQTLLTQGSLWEALERVHIGVKKDHDQRPEMIRRKVALHEAGHTLMCLCFPEYFLFQKVSIQETYAGVGGFTMYNTVPEWDGGQMATKDLLWRQVQLLLGGRVAESVFYGEEHVSVGAHDDLEQANELCRQMVQQFGMGHRLNNIVPGQQRETMSDRLATLMDEDSIRILRSAMQETRRLVQKHKGFVELLAEELLFDVSLSANEVHSLWQTELEQDLKR
jgi:cell division protease FtsH